MAYYTVRLFKRSGTGEVTTEESRWRTLESAKAEASLALANTEAYRAVIDKVAHGALVKQYLMRKGS